MTNETKTNTPAGDEGSIKETLYTSSITGSEQPSKKLEETSDDEHETGYWASLMNMATSSEDAEAGDTASPVAVDWGGILAPALDDCSIMFNPNMLSLAAQAFTNPIEWSRLSQWINTHKIVGMDKRRWQKEVRKLAGTLTVIKGGNNASSATDKPSVGAVWPDAPSPTLPLVPGWIYQTDSLGMATGTGDVLVSDPAYVAEWLHDVNDGTVNLTITHRVGGKWDDLIVPAAALLKSDKVAEMANHGVGIHEPRALGRFLNDHYQLIRHVVPAIAGTKLAGVQTVNGERVAIFPNSVWYPSGQPGQRQTVRLTETAGVTFINVKPKIGGDVTNAQTVLENITKTAESRKIRLLIGWFAAALWSDQIRAAFDGQFPVSNVYGIHESGKTSIIKRLLAAVIGGKEVGTARDTRFRLTRQMSAATSVPLVLDEFRLNEISPNQLASLYDLLRRNYDGGVDGRGQADQTIRTYRLLAPTLVSGESRVTDAALMDRIVDISLTPEEGKQWPGGTDHLRWLEEHLDENRQCAGWLLQKRLDSPMTTKQLRAGVQTLETTLKRLPESQAWPERALWGLAIVWFGLQWLRAIHMPVKEFTTQEWVDILIAGQQARRQSSPVDRFVRFLEEAAGNAGKWRSQAVPMAVLEHTGELRVGVSASNTGFAVWARELGLPNLGQENLEDELVRSGLITDENKLKSPLHLGANVNATLYAYSLKIQVISERYGIPAAYWNEVLRGTPIPI
ncbi:MAG: hypothetical protein C7B43_15300 [Sulfobacillus benefaciens]|uniref:Uncharacterized protein n=1 Tax=Sulfobacillus benefaciens TaxID=453960 RepID=A0A2T2WUX3_9FIRM|nr:MAG: hypothetical protein C7B43_15300 [Sulfobacillus benefaciens]